MIALRMQPVTLSLNLQYTKSYRGVVNVTRRLGRARLVVELAQQRSSLRCRCLDYRPYKIIIAVGGGPNACIRGPATAVNAGPNGILAP
jgi:hypothetical protein